MIYPNISQKIRTCHAIVSAGIIGFLDKETNLSKSELRYILNYLRRYAKGAERISDHIIIGKRKSTRSDRKIAKYLDKFIEAGIRKTGSNFIISNVPSASITRERDSYEVIGTEHIFDTLSEFGTIDSVSLWGDDFYSAFFVNPEEAIETAKKINRMMIGENVIRASYIKPIDIEVVDNVEVVTISSEESFVTNCFIGFLSLFFAMIFAPFVVGYWD